MESSVAITADQEPAHISTAAQRSLSSNLIWTLTGNAIYSLCQWGMLVGIIRAGSTSLAGEYSLGLAITAPLFMLSNMQLSGLLATDGARQFPFAVYRTARWTASLAAMLGATVIALLVPSYRNVLGVVALMAGAKLIESASDITYGYLQRHHRMDRVAIGLIARGVLALVSLVVVLRLTGSLVLAIAALGAAYATVYCLYDARAELIVAPGAPPDDSPAEAWTSMQARLIRLALPLGVASMLTSFAVTLPRLFVEHQLGLSALGVFSALAYLVVAGRLLALPFGVAIAPRMGDALAAGDAQRFRSLFRALLIAGVALGLAGIVAAVLLGGWGLRVLYGASFAQYGRELTVLMTAAAFGYLAVFVQAALTTARVVAAQSFLVALSLAATAAALAVLVPRRGMLGACEAMLIGSAVEAALSALVLASCWRTILGGRT